MKRHYVDEPLVMHRQSDGEDYYYGHDHLYSTVVLIDDGGNVVERYEYDAYGNVRIMDASYNSRTSSSYGNCYLFTGRRLDTLDSNALKIYYYRARYYDPETGRFLQRDPLGLDPSELEGGVFGIENQYVDGLSLYQYVGSRPVIMMDSWGLYGKKVQYPCEKYGEQGICTDVYDCGFFGIGKCELERSLFTKNKNDIVCGTMVKTWTGYYCMTRDEWDKLMDIAWDEEIDAAKCFVDCQLSVLNACLCAGAAGGSVFITHYEIGKTASEIAQGISKVDVTTIWSRAASFALRDLNCPKLWTAMRRVGAQVSQYPVKTGIKIGVTGALAVEAGISVYCSYKCITGN